MFAFEYYSISRYMPFLLVKMSPDSGMISFDEKVYKTFFVLNILMPVVNGVSLGEYNFCDKLYPPDEGGHCTFWSKFQFTALYFVGLLMIISGIYLGYAINKIRGHLSENGGKQQINTAILLVHSATFALYMVSIIVYYVFYTLHYIDYTNQKMTNDFLISGIFA
jgi:hypothetical protein